MVPEQPGWVQAAPSAAGTVRFEVGASVAPAAGAAAMPQTSQ